QFGYLANSRRSTLLALARKLLTTTPPPEACLTGTAASSTWQCPHCHGEMRIGPNLRSSTSSPMQASGQFLDRRKSRDLTACPRARTYLCVRMSAELLRVTIAPSCRPLLARSEVLNGFQSAPFLPLLGAHLPTVPTPKPKKPASGSIA